MCIRCKTKEFALDHAALSMDLASALVDAFQLVERLKERLSDAAGQGLDADEQKAYDSLSAFVKADAEPQAADVQGAQASIVEAVKAAFPGVNVEVVVGSPEQVEAQLEKLMTGNKNKPH